MYNEISIGQDNNINDYEDKHFYHGFLGNLDVFDRTYNTLIQDKYVKEGFRYKAIKRFIYDESGFIGMPNSPLFQENTINPVHGGIIRDYPMLNLDSGEKRTLEKILLTFCEISKIRFGTKILVQFQRIKCSNDLEGLTAVEGWHRDGVDHLMIACVNRSNVKGGVSMLKTCNGPNKNLFEKVLGSGDYILLNDSKLLHYASSITPVDKKHTGYRDVIIVCTPSCMEPSLTK